MADASITERLKLLETEVESLKIKVTEDCHWRKILEEWLLNRFGFDINIELKKKPLTHFNLPDGETSNKIEIDKVEEESANSPTPLVGVPDEILLVSEDTSNLENDSVPPTEVNVSNTTESEECKEANNISKSSSVPNSSAISSRVGSNVNFAVSVTKTTQEKTQPDKDINAVASKVPVDLSAEADLTKAFITELSQIPENTEYHVTLKAKNAIKKLENRENSYECKECKQVFDNIYKAEGHARHHFETKFKCIDCPLYFEVEQDLILHAQVVHYKIRKRLNSFTCYIGGCPWTSKSPEALRHHRTLKHSESKPTANIQDSPAQPVTAVDSSKNDSDDVEIQDVSGAASNSSAAKAEDKPPEQSPRKAEADDLISYKGRNNGENSQWQCKVCEKTFSELSLAKTHVGKTHFTLHFPSSEKKGRHVVCRICKKAFSNDNWLKRHELSEHRSSIKKYALL